MDCSFQAKNHVHSTFLEHIYDNTMLTSVVDLLHSFSLVSFSSLFFLFFSSPLLPSLTTWLTTYQVSKAHQLTTPTHFIPLLFILSFSLLCFCADAGANKFIWRWATLWLRAQAPHQKPNSLFEVYLRLQPPPAITPPTGQDASL